MWRAGVSVLMWTQLKDYPFVRGKIPYQGGLYSWGGNGRVGAPKGAMRAFRFPFVALKRTGGAYVWGRTPWGKAGRVKIQKKTSRGWATVKIVRTNGNGIFKGRFFFSTSSTGRMRARRVGSSLSSVSFSLKPPKSLMHPAARVLGLRTMTHLQRRTYLVAFVVVIGLAVAEHRLGCPPPVIDQYYEEIPTANGGVGAGGGAAAAVLAEGVCLRRSLNQLESSVSPAVASELQEVATSSRLGAPSAMFKKPAQGAGESGSGGHGGRRSGQQCGDGCNRRR